MLLLRVREGEEQEDQGGQGDDGGRREEEESDYAHSNHLVLRPSDPIVYLLYLCIGINQLYHNHAFH